MKQALPMDRVGPGSEEELRDRDQVITCDTAATALWLLDVPRPDDLDGKPVTSAFE